MVVFKTTFTPIDVTWCKNPPLFSFVCKLLLNSLPLLIIYHKTSITLYSTYSRAKSEADNYTMDKST